MEERDNIVLGRNPVLEALKSGREIDKLYVVKDGEGSIRKIVGMAKDNGIVIQYTDRNFLNKMCEGKNHQGVACYISPYRYATVEEILALAKQREEDPFLILLDGIEDPHNLGSIIRSAEGAGAHGIIIPKRRAVGITETVVKTSAGAIEYMPVARVSNITQTIERLKELNIWIGAVDMDGSDYYEANLTGKIGLVIGNEGSGISKLVKSVCDFTVSIPMAGKVSSLNASNAAAVLMYEIQRQRRADGGTPEG